MMFSPSWKRSCLSGVSNQKQVSRRDGVGNTTGSLWSVESKSPSNTYGVVCGEGVYFLGICNEVFIQHWN